MISHPNSAHKLHLRPLLGHNESTFELRGWAFEKTVPPHCFNTYLYSETDQIKRGINAQNRHRAPFSTPYSN